MSAGGVGSAQDDQEQQKLEALASYMRMGGGAWVVLFSI